MRLIDLSQPVYHNAPNCPDHPVVVSETVIDHQSGEWHLEMLHLSNHTGSHVDAPLHKIAGGKSLSEMPLETFVGDAYIADLRHKIADSLIDAADLSVVLRGDLSDKIILLATGWGDKRGHNDEWLHHSPQLSPDGAAWLVENKVRGVGINHYSVGGAETHAVLLGAGIWIVEELRIVEEVFRLPQPVHFWCLPINLQGHSGAFCRPVIVTE